MFKDTDVLGNGVKTLRICQIEHYDSTLAISEVRPRQGEELLLPLSIPYLQADRPVFYLDGQAFEIHSDSVHSAFLLEVLIDKPNQKASFARACLPK